MTTIADPLRRLEELGQSIWLDFIDPTWLDSDELARRVREDHVRGVTSNPTIFEKAVVGTKAYDAFIGQARASDGDARVLERLMVRDIVGACDVLRPTYDGTSGADGFASIELDPTLAEETGAMVEQAVRLWEAVDRPNLMVKIPATRAGLPAIRSCIAHGINVNVTLLFSVARYREVVEAFLKGLERRVAVGQPLDRVASVASFFVSRVDTKVDKLLDALTKEGRAEAARLRGEIGIANAKLAYEAYDLIVATDRWKKLAAHGARPQRLLWASTSSKDERYPDLYYANALVGADTIDTMTVATLEAYRDHGEPQARLRSKLDESRARMAALAELGIDFVGVAEELEDEGVASFAASQRKLLEAIARARLASRGGTMPARRDAP